MDTTTVFERIAGGGVTAPAGFLASGVSAGIKPSGKPDVAMIACATAVPAAAVFTTNTMAAPPVNVSRAHIAHGTIRATVVNSGNANACTGEQGTADAIAMAQATATALGCDPHQVIVASTGVIGVPMPMDAVLSGIAAAAAAIGAQPAGVRREFDSPRLQGGADAASAIRTTDTFAKEVAVAFDVDGVRCTVGGMAKGSGMIKPNMATMLAYVTTDAPLTSAACDAALRAAVGRTFNRITIDGDTSTNDMCLLMASGAAGGPAIEPGTAAFDTVLAAIHYVCAELSRMIVRDGEGATKFIEVTVRGAATESDAEAAAFSIADSPLFKTAIFGGDANWGRVAMAVGKSSAMVDPDALEVVFAGITTCLNGTAVAFDEDAAAAALALPNVEVVADLHVGAASATVWTCDLTYEYVRINGEYRS